MPFKILFKDCGFTLVELVMGIGVIFVVMSALLLTLRPAEMRLRARDASRINHLHTLDRMINEYLQDMGTLPDSISTLRQSQVLPSGSSDLSSSNYGWISADLSKYNAKLPLDPINDSTYHLTYFHNGVSYELNVLLEGNASLMQDDGGNNPDLYELGTGINFLSP